MPASHSACYRIFSNGDVETAARRSSLKKHLMERPMGRTAAILIARLIFAGAFAMAAGFKFAGMSDTAGYIAAAGFPFPLLLAWLAAIFEVALVLAFLTGAFFSEAALLSGIYVIFLAFAFHGPSRWEGNQAEFGFFIDHFTFLAGLLYAAVHGPGDVLAMRKGFIWQR
jgi:putative oxidoreductase